MNNIAYSKKTVFIAACFGIFLFGISIITLGSTLPQLSLNFSLTEIQKGTLASILPFGILMGSLIFGPIVDRYSYKYLLSFSVFLIFIGFEMIAYGEAVYQLDIAFFLIGSGGGMINGATSSVVADFSEDSGENKGANLSLLGVFFGLGALGMPVILGSLKAWYSYGSIMAGLGMFMIIPLILMLAIKFPAPKQAQGISPGDVGLLLKDSWLLLLGLILFFQSGWESLMNNWTSTFLISMKGLPEDTALFFLTVFVIAFTIGRLLLGILLKKFPGRFMIIISAITALTGGIILSIAISDLLIIIALVITGLGLAAGFPVVLGILGDLFAKWSGTAFGIALTIALIGNMIINYLVGIFTSIYGMGAYRYILIITGLCTSLLIIMVLNRKSINNN